MNKKIEYNGARVVGVVPGSPADDAGFGAGCYVTAVDGQPVRDIIDWRWLTSEDQVTLTYIGADGDRGDVDLIREEGEDWGLSFDGLVFDDVKLCRNACKFCFMRQLPHGMRPSLTLRDDDFRLSFLTGTFVTLTNLTAEDEARIIEQHLSPLRVSLHATDHDVRQRLMGKHEACGLNALERLLDGGIEVHAQIVLVPGENDGEVLDRTLRWAYTRPGILSVGIVPLGFTKWQSDFSRSFNDASDARRVIEAIMPFQRKAEAERGNPWVFAADEFYRNAYGDELLDHLPIGAHYGDYAMFEDGIGIIRSYVDEFVEACECGLAQQAADALEAAGLQAFFVVGEAMQPFLEQLLAKSPLVDRLRPLTVHNDFFGGNVDVTGLLTAADVSRAIAEAAAPNTLFLVPRVMFNDDGITLDDRTAADIETLSNALVRVVSCNPLDYLEEIIALARASH